MSRGLRLSHNAPGRKTAYPCFRFWGGSEYAVMAGVAFGAAGLGVDEFFFPVPRPTFCLPPCRFSNGISYGQEIGAGGVSIFRRSPAGNIAPGRGSQRACLILGDRTWDGTTQKSGGGYSKLGRMSPRRDLARRPVRFALGAEQDKEDIRK
jgi:hypothetical protein